MIYQDYLLEIYIMTITLLPFLIITFSVWTNAFFYLFIGVVILFSIITWQFMKKFTLKNKELTRSQQQQIAKIDMLRKNHIETLELIREDMLKREEERTRQWMESEKETLHVLNGVSQLLELSENIGRVESTKIINKIDEIKGMLENNKKK